MRKRRFYGYQDDALWFDKQKKSYFAVDYIKRLARKHDKRLTWKRGWPYFEGRPMVYVETKWTRQ